MVCAYFTPEVLGAHWTAIISRNLTINAYEPVGPTYLGRPISSSKRGSANGDLDRPARTAPISRPLLSMSWPGGWIDHIRGFGVAVPEGDLYCSVRRGELAARRMELPTWPGLWMEGGARPYERCFLGIVVLHCFPLSLQATHDSVVLDRRHLP